SPGERAAETLVFRTALGKEEADMATLAETIHLKIDAGVLPRDQPARARVGSGGGSPCTACDMPILPAQVEWSFWSGPVVTHRLHLACHGLWERECRRRGWRAAG